MTGLNNAWAGSQFTKGRLMIMTDLPEITEDNIESVVTTAFQYHQQNAAEELFLFNYEKGDQPIRSREKKIRPEINCKLVENNASRIIDTHVGYCFSNPITLVQRAKVETGKSDSESDTDDLEIGMLNKMFAEQAKGSKDIELARNLFICGLGYQMVLPARNKKKYAPFEVTVPNPLTSFMVYSNDVYRDPVLGCTYSQHEDGTISLTAYSDNWCFELEQSVNDFAKKKITPNVLGMIPLVEFALNDRMGIFEKAIPIMDAINIIDSDRINDIMQHVQSLLWMHNCEIDKDGKQKLEEGGVINTKSSGDGREAKITYLSDTLDQSQIQTQVNHLLETLEQITATPSWKEASGGSTTGAMQLSNGWQCLEISAKAIEQIFVKDEMKVLETAIEIIKADLRDYEGLKDIEVSDIEIRFCRTKTYDLVSKTNALVSLINAGVDGLTAFNTVGLFTDAQQAYNDSARIIDGIQEKMIEDNTTNVIKGANAYRDENGNGGENNEEKDKTEESMQPSKVSGVTE